MSLTQALNNASNRAVRRILLAKCWPSEQALNLSLRLAAAAEKQAEEARVKAGTGSTAKCPVPRPILNLLMRRGDNSSSSSSSTKDTDSSIGDAAKDVPSSPRPSSSSSPPTPSRTGRTMEQYVEDQIKAFRERYGTLAGYDYAEAYLESILSLATTGKESPRVKDVLESKVYDESYRRVISVLKSVGVVLDNLPDSEQRFQFAAKLNDQNFCLSMLDILAMKKEAEADKDLEVVQVHSSNEVEDEVDDEAEQQQQDDADTTNKRSLRFWKKKGDGSSDDSAVQEATSQPKDDGRVILCSDEPSMTRQLNGLSNIVHRGLLYGGDQELLVLSETVADNRDTFVERWYPNTGPFTEEMEDETRQGVQYLNALVSLLRKAYDEGAVTNLDPLVEL
ncbi:MAG: hypothetical protein SGARI_002500, partial [Bacillariaceae sp.]